MGIAENPQRAMSSTSLKSSNAAEELSEKVGLAAENEKAEVNLSRNKAVYVRQPNIFLKNFSTFFNRLICRGREVGNLRRNREKCPKILHFLQSMNSKTFL